MNNAEQPLCEAPKREADFPFREVYETYIRNFSRSSFFPEVNPDEAACSCCGHLQKVDKKTISVMCAECTSLMFFQSWDG